MSNNVMPIVTDIAGLHWKQPKREAIEIDDNYAMMNESSLFMLTEHTYSSQAGAFIGKMWRYYDGCWVLCWCDNVGDELSVCEREILIVNEWDE